MFVNVLNFKSNELMKSGQRRARQRETLHSQSVSSSVEFVNNMPAFCLSFIYAEVMTLVLNTYRRIINLGVKHSDTL